MYSRKSPALDSLLRFPGAFMLRTPSSHERSHVCVISIHAINFLKKMLMVGRVKNAVHSEVFEVGGYEWKLEMYPYGDSQSDKTLSVFLCAVDRKQLPGWSQTAHYQIAVVNKDPSKTSTHTGYDIFRGKRDSAVRLQRPHNIDHVCPLFCHAHMQHCACPKFRH
jgi:hypothetical protein